MRPSVDSALLAGELVRSGRRGGGGGGGVYSPVGCCIIERGDGLAVEAGHSREANMQILMNQYRGGAAGQGRVGVGGGIGPVGVEAGPFEG